MSVTPEGEQNLPTKVYDGLETGMEDFGIDDVVTPRLTIQHKTGRLKDSLTGELFETLDVVLLGVVKQRVMWDTTVGTGDQPLCKSANFTEGYPQINDDLPASKRFPWDKSNFDRATLPVLPDGQIKLPCETCRFKEWNTDPSGKKPWCSETHTFPLLYDPTGSGRLVPAIFSVQKTGLKSSKAYVSGFFRAGAPLYTARTRLSFNMQGTGENMYSIPVFTKNGTTENEQWPEFSQHYRSMREFLVSAPGVQEVDEEGAPAGYKPQGSWGGDAQPAAPSDPIDAVIVHEPPAAPAPAPVAAAPVAPPAPAPAPPAPPAEPVAAVQAAAPAAVPAPSGDDELPF